MNRSRNIILLAPIPELTCCSCLISWPSGMTLTRLTPCGFEICPMWPLTSDPIGIWAGDGVLLMVETCGGVGVLLDPWWAGRGWLWPIYELDISWPLDPLSGEGPLGIFDVLYCWKRPSAGTTDPPCKDLDKNGRWDRSSFWRAWPANELWPPDNPKVMDCDG